MKPVKTNKKFIKGIIYDNPIQKNGCINDAIGILNGITDLGETAYNEISWNEDEYIPSKNEFLISLSISAMLTSSTHGERNLLIPSEMLDNNLYERLSKIDIGDKILHGYIDDRISNATQCSKLIETNKSQDIVVDQIDENGSLFKTVKFDNKEDVRHWIMDKHSNGQITDQKALELLAQLEDM